MSKRKFAQIKRKLKRKGVIFEGFGNFIRAEVMFESYGLKRQRRPMWKGESPYAYLPRHERVWIRTFYWLKQQDVNPLAFADWLDQTEYGISPKDPLTRIGESFTRIGESFARFGLSLISFLTGK